MSPIPRISRPGTALLVGTLLAAAIGGAGGAAPAAAQQPAPEKVTFSSSGTTMVGTFHRPDTSAARPVVLIAHGFGGLQTSRLQPIADAFADAGYNALTFDYRSWGQSSGTPRNVIDIKKQQEDYEAAMAAAKRLPGVDPKRIVLWGTSFSGGHVLELATRHPELSAVIAQAPHVNGLATVAKQPFGDIPGKTAAGIEDAGRALLGRSPKYIPLTGETGTLATLTQPEAVPGYQFVQPTSPAPGNVTAARIILALPFFSPDLTNRGTSVPTLMSVKTDDEIVDPNAAENMARRIGAELDTYPGGHFDVYPGATGWPQVIADQIAFLRTKVPVS